MNRTSKAKFSLFVLGISTIAAPFVISNNPTYGIPNSSDDAPNEVITVSKLPIDKKAKMRTGRGVSAPSTKSGVSAPPTKSGGGTIAAIEAGVRLFDEVVKIYKQLNPPQEGYVTVVNTLKETVTVRSYNNNDWAKFVAAGQINLKPGASANITAETDPVVLVWKRGNYGTLKGFGTRNLNQSTQTKQPKKGQKKVFVIGEDNTI